MKISLNTVDSYKNTSAQRIPSGFYSVFVHETIDRNSSVSATKIRWLYLEKAAASKRIFTLLGPLFVRSQGDDFSAIAGALVANITTCGIKNTFGKTQKMSYHLKKPGMKGDLQKAFLPILLLVVWTTSVSSAVCCLSRWRYFSAKYLKTIKKKQKNCYERNIQNEFVCSASTC